MRLGPNSAVLALNGADHIGVERVERLERIVDILEPCRAAERAQRRLEMCECPWTESGTATDQFGEPGMGGGGGAQR